MIISGFFLICLGYIEFWIYLNNLLEYAKICQNMSECYLHFPFVIPCLLECVVISFNVYINLKVVIWKNMRLFSWRNNFFSIIVNGSSWFRGWGWGGQTRIVKLNILFIKFTKSIWSTLQKHKWNRLNIAEIFRSKDWDKNIQNNFQPMKKKTGSK